MEYGFRGQGQYGGDRDDPDRYKLIFTESQRDELKAGYLAHRRPGNHRLSPDQMDFEAKVFVGTIESFAEGENYFEETVPDTQKDRKNTLKSIGLAVMKLDQALNELDSEAMGYLYAHLVDGLAVSGVQLSPADNTMTSMLNEHLRAVVEGGEMRKTIRAVAATIVQATDKASESLPKYDHVKNNRCLRMAKTMERFMWNHQLPFEAKETGYAVQCLRAMFDLAGIDVEKPGYWIKKAIDDPDSHARWIEKMQVPSSEN